MSIVWTKNLEVGVTLIDEQHKKLFEKADWLLYKLQKNRRICKETKIIQKSESKQ